METPNGAKIAIEEEYKRQVKRNREKRFDIPMTQANQWRDGAKWGYSLSQKEIEELGTKLIKAMQEANELGEENRKLKEDLEQANKFFKNLYDE